MIEMFRVQQETLLRGALTGLLAQISQDYNLDNAELLKRYLEPTGQSQIKNGDSVPAPILVMAQQEKTKKRTQKAKADKVCCKGTPAKGHPCKFAALGDGFCKKHSEMNSKPDKPRTQKPKQEKPRHTHLTEEEPEETCQVCEQQGDVTRPEMPRQDWEIQGADEIKARLARMLAEVEEAEETPEENKETVSMEELMGESQLEAEMINEAAMNGDNTPQGSEARLKKILSEETDDEDDE
ncbi:MAG: DUF5763 domain-containing protein [Burkholderiaceae bacterium]